MYFFSQNFSNLDAVKKKVISINFQYKRTQKASHILNVSIALIKKVYEHNVFISAFYIRAWNLINLEAIVKKLR